jgi:hypothetical protein
MDDKYFMTVRRSDHRTNRLLMDDEFNVVGRVERTSSFKLFNQHETFILYENQAVITMTVIHQ